MSCGANRLNRGSGKAHRVRRLKLVARLVAMEG